MQTLSKSLKFLLYYLSCHYLGTKDNPIEVIEHCLGYQIKIPHIEVVFFLIFALNLNALFHFFNLSVSHSLTFVITLY